MTLAILRLCWKQPVENERFMICESGSWRILTGMLKGPLLLLVWREEIQDKILALFVGD